jgi:hypothetical protein
VRPVVSNVASAGTCALAGECCGGAHAHSRRHQQRQLRHAPAGV